jgi:hypothetical protein
MIARLHDDGGLTQIARRARPRCLLDLGLGRADQRAIAERDFREPVKGRFRHRADDLINAVRRLFRPAAL